MHLVISRLLPPLQGGMITAILVEIVSVSLAIIAIANPENHATGNHESSESLRLLESSESLLHPESTVNLQQLETIAGHLHPENHPHLGW